MNIHLNSYIFNNLCQMMIILVMGGLNVFAGHPEKDSVSAAIETSRGTLKTIEPIEFSSFQMDQIGDRIVHWKERMIGDITIEKNIKVYIFGKGKEGLVDKRIKWDSLSLPLAQPTLSAEVAKSIAGGEADCARLLLISTESNVYPMKPKPKNPCWIVSTSIAGQRRFIVVDAITGKRLGQGITPPEYRSFSMSGPMEYTCDDDAWTDWYSNAGKWFNLLGYTCITCDNWGPFCFGPIWGAYPSSQTIQSMIQSNDISLFYELAHGGATSFTATCSSPQDITSAQVRNWISNFSPMRFTFIGSCGGLTRTNPGSFAWEFRRGLNPNTAVIGYNSMDGAACSGACWENSVDWQTDLFQEIKNGKTVLQAFNTANSRHPECGNNNCMRFFGDRDCKFTTRTFTNWQLVGDPSFSSDCGADLLFFNPNDNTFHVTVSIGNGFQGNYNPPWISSNGFGSIMGNYFPGDFNGDGTMDLGYLESDNSFHVRLGTGTGFTIAPSGSRWIEPNGFGGTWGKHYTGDFNGDGRDDLLFFEPSNNTIHVTISTGTSFGGTGSGQWIGTNGFGSLRDNYFPADFNGDHKVDLGYLEGNSSFHVRLSSGTAFTSSPSGLYLPPNSFGGTYGTYHIGDFNGDGKDDLLFFEPGDNTIHVNICTGIGFWGAGSGRWIGPNGFGSLRDNYFPGDFDGDGITDLAYLEGNNSIHVRLSTGTGFEIAPIGSQWIQPDAFGGSFGRYYVSTTKR